MRLWDRISLINTLPLDCSVKQWHNSMQGPTPGFWQCQHTHRLGREAIAEQPCRAGLGGDGWWKTQHDLAMCTQPRQPTWSASKAVWATRQGVLSSALVKPHLQCWVLFKYPQSMKDMELRKAIKLGRGLGHFPYKDRLRNLILFSLGKRRLHGDLIATFQNLKGTNHKARGGVFIRNCSEW